MNADTKYLIPKRIQHPDIDEHCWKFFCDARSKNIPVNGPMLQAEAVNASLKFGKDGFVASNGWLQSFIHRHKIRMVNLHGESADVDKSCCDQWLEKLPELCQGYQDRDIYNCDETGIFFRSVPTKSFVRENEVHTGTKVLKDRFTVLLTCNLAGEKEKMWIIGRAKKPHSFPKHSADMQHLCIYRNNSKGWMKSDIFIDYLNWMITCYKMILQKRRILLFLDNCPSHPDVQLSNVKCVFLPRNTTSKLQPLDQGIIASLKARYKRLMMLELVSSMSDADSMTELAKKVTIFDAILNTKLAWDGVSTEGIVKCWKKAGFKENTDETQRDLTNQPTHEPLPSTISDVLEVSWEEYLAL